MKLIQIDKARITSFSLMLNPLDDVEKLSDSTICIHEY